MNNDTVSSTQPDEVGTPEDDQAITQLRSSYDADFSDFEASDCKEYVEAIFADYERYLKFLYQGAQIAAERATEFTENARNWRVKLIWLTGAVALLNTAAAFSLFNNLGIWKFESAETQGDYNVTVAVILTIIAALVAIVATILGNVENFRAYAERAARKRELREMYYGAYLKYLTRWKTQVVPHGAKPAACVAAIHHLENIVEDLSVIRKQAGEIAIGKSADPSNPVAGQG